jgi:hypothetical protein
MLEYNNGIWTPKNVCQSEFWGWNLDVSGNGADPEVVAGGGGGGYTSPFATYGWTFVSAREALTKGYTDQAGTSLITADGDFVRNMKVSEAGGSLFGNFNSPGDLWKWTDGTNAAYAIAGKPTYYSVNDALSQAHSADVANSTMLTGDDICVIAVMRRYALTDNVQGPKIGSSKHDSRFYASNVYKNYGSITSYVEVTTPSVEVETFVYMWRWVEADGKWYFSKNGGTEAELEQTAPWTWSTEKMGHGQGPYGFVEWGVNDGVGADRVAIIAALMAEYGIS